MTTLATASRHSLDVPRDRHGPDAEFRRLRATLPPRIPSQEGDVRFSQLPEGWEDSHPKVPSRMESSTTLTGTSTHSLVSTTTCSGCSTLSMITYDDTTTNHTTTSSKQDQRPVLPGRVKSKPHMSAAVSSPIPPHSSSQRFKVMQSSGMSCPKIPVRRQSDALTMPCRQASLATCSNQAAETISEERGSDVESDISESVQVLDMEDHDDEDDNDTLIQSPIQRTLSRQSGALRLHDSPTTATSTTTSSQPECPKSSPARSSPTSKIKHMAAKMLQPSLPTMFQNKHHHHHHPSK